MLVFGAHRPSCYKIGEPKRVQRGKILNSVGIFKPLLPQVIMLVVCHSTLALNNTRLKMLLQRMWPNSQDRFTILIRVPWPGCYDHNVKVSKCRLLTCGKSSKAANPTTAPESRSITVIARYDVSISFRIFGYE